MCGRYSFDVNANPDFQKLIDQAKNHLTNKQLTLLQRGEIAPGQTAFLFTRNAAGHYHTTLARWGFASRSARLIINARSETADSSPFFQSCRRCLVYAGGYYEWSADHTRYLFLHQRGTIGLGGLLHREADGRLSFVILTQAASGKAAEIHDRMPLAYDHDSADAFFSAGTIQQAAALSLKDREQERA